MPDTRRLVIDTNVLVSAFVGHGKPRRLVSELLRKHQVIVSPQLLAELADVLSREKVGASQYQIGRFVSLVARSASIVTPLSIPGSVPEDPDDEVILGTALRGHATHIVTGDRHLLNLGTFRGIRLVTVAETFDVLKTRGGRGPSLIGHP